MVSRDNSFTNIILASDGLRWFNTSFPGARYIVGTVVSDPKKLATGFLLVLLNIMVES